MKTRSSLVLLALLAGHAAAGTITNGNARFDYTAGYNAPNGDANFFADYTSSSVNSGDYVSRTTWSNRRGTGVGGSTTRDLLGAFNTPTETYVGDTLTAKYTNGFVSGGSYSLNLTSRVVDGAVPGAAQLISRITITNTSAASYAFEFFHEYDGTAFDASANPGANDNIALVGGDPTYIRTTDAGTNYTEIKYTVPANVSTVYKLGKHSEVSGYFSSSGTGTVSGADVASSVRFAFTLGVNESVSIDYTIAINSQAPTPGSLSLLGFAGLVATRRRRA